MEYPVTTCLETCVFLYVAVLIETHQLSKYNGHRPCSNRDMTYLICHAPLQDHVIKESCNFMEGSCALRLVETFWLVGTFH